jgi:hypothetical protein
MRHERVGLRGLSAGADKLLRMVQAQVWTVIGLLAATLIGTLVYLGGRIESLGARMESRIDGLGGGTDARIESLGARMESRIDGLGGRTDTRIESLGARMESRIDGLSARIDGLSARIEEQGAQLGERLYELAVKLDDHLRWHAG